MAYRYEVEDGTVTMPVHELNRLNAKMEDVAKTEEKMEETLKLLKLG